MSEFWIENNQTVLFIGDSITDCGRRDAQAPLGSGYVRLFVESATARFPSCLFRPINKGIGGNRVTDLQERWRDDVLYHKPDRLSIKIGINDLHSHLRDPANGISPGLFAEIYGQLLEFTRRELGCPVVLLTPFYISTDHGGSSFRSQVLAQITDYIQVTEQLSDQFKTRLVRLHDIFQEHLKHREADTFCPEPVHPNHAGHQIIAQALMDTLTR